MKPGMQRDILVAFWLLFDEFEIGDDDAPPRDPSTSEKPHGASHPAAGSGKKVERGPDRPSS
jgi:hypothetical protein